jgi:hypothetical protein
MKISVSHDLSVGDVTMRTLSVSSLRRAIGKPDSEEKIPMHGGGVRLREIWSVAGIATLRDEEESAACLIADPAATDVAVAKEMLPDTEREFLKAHPSAKKSLGHSCILMHGRWRLDLDFAKSSKRGGVGSNIRRLSRVSIALNKEPIQSITDNDGAAPRRV